MREDRKQARMREIEAVAYEVLAEQGYDGTSMLAVAKRAKASNETLYRWYGDKKGLFASMVRANADEVRRTLDRTDQAGLSPLDRLHRLAPVLLGMLMGERAISLNRAAAADVTGELGCAIAEGGRESILPLLAGVMEEAVRDGALMAPREGAIAPLFMHLLVGDQQIRRVIGALPAPTEAEVVAQASVAMAQFRTLCAP